MLDNAPFAAAFISGIISLSCFGYICSLPQVWNTYFKTNGQVIGGIYLKAGEYGESEEKNTNSVFIEPLNAWSSLSYSLYGFVMCFVGINDFITSKEAAVNSNFLTMHSLFSILYGASAIYLGIASFLFHASHSEIWRKIDAGMTSGVVVPLFMMGIWDRARPIGISSFFMIFLTMLIQSSLIHGYLPYGSSDILVPSFVAIGWTLELHPRYGGVVDIAEYHFWIQSFYAIVGGMLLRAADIKRKSPKVFSNLILGFYALSFGFGYFLGYSDYVIIAGVVSGAVVAIYPARGHVFWHLLSSFSLFIWWYSLRVRSGDPELPFSVDRSLIVIALYIGVKNAWRRCGMSLPFPSDQMRDRVLILTEHILVVILGWYVLVVEPGNEQSMLRNPALCWSTKPIPSDLFHFYYQLQVAFKLEDILYMAVKLYLDAKGTSEKENSKERDWKMMIHHVVTGVLCVASYSLGYANIGAVVMFLHDISDIPLDLLRISMLLDAKMITLGLYSWTVSFWLTWRLYYFPVKVLYSVAVDSKSVNYPSNCEVGKCTWNESPERAPFLILLGSLFILQIIWFIEMIKKGQRELSTGNIIGTGDETAVLLGQQRN